MFNKLLKRNQKFTQVELDYFNNRRDKAKNFIESEVYPFVKEQIDKRIGECVTAMYNSNEDKRMLFWQQQGKALEDIRNWFDSWSNFEYTKEDAEITE